MTNESSRFRRFGERGPMRTEIIDLKWCFSLRRNSSKEAKSHEKDETKHVEPTKFEPCLTIARTIPLSAEG